MKKRIIRPFIAGLTSRTVIGKLNKTIQEQQTIITNQASELSENRHELQEVRQNIDRCYEANKQLRQRVESAESQLFMNPLARYQAKLEYYESSHYTSNGYYCRVTFVPDLADPVKSSQFSRYRYGWNANGKIPYQWGKIAQLAKTFPLPDGWHWSGQDDGLTMSFSQINLNDLSTSIKRANEELQKHLDNALMADKYNEIMRPETENRGT